MTRKSVDPPPPSTPRVPSKSHTPRGSIIHHKVWSRPSSTTRCWSFNVSSTSWMIFVYTGMYPSQAPRRYPADIPEREIIHVWTTVIASTLLII